MLNALRILAFEYAGLSELELEVKESNSKAINVYMKNGFISNPQPASPLLAMSLRNNHE